MKHPIPEPLRQYIAWRSKEPQFCHNCVNYDLKTAYCHHHKAEVPADFTQQEGACDAWTNCPF